LRAACQSSATSGRRAKRLRSTRPAIVAKAARAAAGSERMPAISRAVLAGFSQSGRASAIWPTLRFSSRCVASS
jgi:hypothetical protein